MNVMLFLSMLAITPVFISLPMMAEASPSHYGITLGKTCMTMLQNNLDSDCPTYEQLLLLFQDTSNPNISGGFVQDDNGFLHRENTSLKNHFEFYRYHSTDFIVWIDPPGDIQDRIQLITIEPSLPEFKIQSVSHKYQNNTIQTGFDRWVNDSCDKATISAENWLFLAGDTVRLMQHGCNHDYSYFDNVKTIEFKKTIFDITTSYKWQLDNWISESLEKCKGLCFEY